MLRTIFIFLLIFFEYALFGQNDSTKIKQVDKWFEKYNNTSQNKPDEALKFLDSALCLSKKISYKKGITDVIREKGSFYSERSDYVKAMQLLINALRLDDQNNNEDGIGTDLNFIGLLYQQQEKMDEAISYLIKARDEFSKIKKEDGVAMENCNMGMVYRDINKYELALKCYFLSRDYYQKEKNEINLSHIENNIGNVYKDIKQYDKALEHFLISENLKTKNNLLYSQVSTLSNIGDVYLEKNNLSKALDFYNKALAIAKDQKSLRLQKDVFLDISNVYKKQGNYKTAYDFYKESTRLKDSIISEKYNNEMEDMKVKYETEKKEHENKILLKDNELQSVKIENEKKQKLLFASLSLIILFAGVFVFIQYRTKQKLNKQLAQINEKIKNQNNTLKTLNKELIDSEENLTLANASKDQLISMLSHDLYNPITSVINYTNLTLETTEQQTKEDLQNSLKAINNAVIPLQDLLDNILQWARVQRNKMQPDYDKVELVTIVTDIIKLYKPLAAFKQVSIEYDFAGDKIIETDRLMLYFIIRNIVNNAVKFSPKQGAIKIVTVCNDKMVSISVKDQGAGFSPKTFLLLNSSNTNDLVHSKSGNGIGLSVSRELVKLLNGEMIFKNSEQGGAEVILNLHRI